MSMNIQNPAPRRRWPAAIAIGALIATVGAGSFAFGAGMPMHGGWGEGAKLGMVQHRVHDALESVGATMDQEAQVHDIVARTVTGLEQNGFDRDAVRKQMVDLLRAPTIDSAAVEKLRAEQVAKLDATSKTVVGALLDAAGKLSPEQRGKLVDRFAEMRRHGHDGEKGRHSEDGRQGGDERPAKPDGATPDHG